MALLDRFVDARPATADEARVKAKNAQFAARVVAGVAVVMLLLILVPPYRTVMRDALVAFVLLGILWMALHVRALDLRQSYWDLRD